MGGRKSEIRNPKFEISFYHHVGTVSHPGNGTIPSFQPGEAPDFNAKKLC